MVVDLKSIFRVDLLRQDVVAVGDHLVLGGEEAEQLDRLVTLPLENRVMLGTNQMSVSRCHQPIRGEYLQVTWTTTTALSTPSSSLVIPHLARKNVYTRNNISENMIKISIISLHRKYR